MVVVVCHDESSTFEKSDQLDAQDSCPSANVPGFLLVNNSGSFAMFAATRRVLSFGEQFCCCSPDPFQNSKAVSISAPTALPTPNAREGNEAVELVVEGKPHLVPPHASQGDKASARP